MAQHHCKQHISADCMKVHSPSCSKRSRSRCNISAARSADWYQAWGSIGGTPPRPLAGGKNDGPYKRCNSANGKSHAAAAAVGGSGKPPTTDADACGQSRTDLMSSLQMAWFLLSNASSLLAINIRTMLFYIPWEMRSSPTVDDWKYLMAHLT